MEKVLIIIPAYNERNNLPALMGKIDNLKKHYDILVINDCSSDDTKKFCEINELSVVNLPINLGIGGAVQTGFKYALEHGYEIAVQVDGDGQHKPIYIEQLISKIIEGNNMVIGSRFIENEGYQSTLIRRIGIKYFQLLIRILSKHNMSDPTSGFRAFDKKAIEYFSKYYPSDFPEPETIIMSSKKGMKISEIPVTMDERASGKSSINTLKSLYYVVKVTIALIICSTSRGDNDG